ncbi:NAD(P)-dependent dehydrogenase (short-subunit alcohol dehydrogenase family) [Paenibacillus mucilaginosus]
MKTVLVTGANSGMGLATSVELAKRGYYVIMACRDEVRGQKSIEEARRQSGSNHLELRKLDLASLESIRNFAAQFRYSFNHLDVLINKPVCLPSNERLRRMGSKA